MPLLVGVSEHSDHQYMPEHIDDQASGYLRSYSLGVHVESLLIDRTNCDIVEALALEKLLIHKHKLQNLRCSCMGLQCMCPIQLQLWLINCNLLLLLCHDKINKENTALIKEPRAVLPRSKLCDAQGREKRLKQYTNT